MVKKVSPAEKAARMLDLVPFISTHQGISLEDLASEFAISKSELLSDLNSLWMCGDSRFDLIELEFESGYVFIRNAETIHLVRALSSQEIIAILIGLELIENFLPSEKNDLLQSISSLKSKLGGGLERVVLAIPSSSSSTLLAVNDALNTSRRLKIDYYTPVDDRVTTRVISPLEIFHSEQHDFILAFCELSDAQRTFRIDRIRSVEILDKEIYPAKKEHQPGKTLEARLSLLRSERKWREFLGAVIDHNSRELKVSTYSSAWLVRTVISAAGSMVLTDPPHIRSEISQAAKKTLDLYL